MDLNGFDQIVNEVLDDKEQYVVAETSSLWTELGIADTMAGLQGRVAAMFKERGLGISFQAHIFVPDAELPEHRDFSTPEIPALIDLKVESMRALSIQQPWVERILRGEKNIEYRSRRIKEMGPLLLHASGTVVTENFERVDMLDDIERLPYRALVGVVDVIDVVAVEGEEKLYEWRLAHPRRFAMPIPYSGAASIFRVPMADIKMYLRSVIAQS